MRIVAQFPRKAGPANVQLGRTITDVQTAIEKDEDGVTDVPGVRVTYAGSGALVFVSNEEIEAITAEAFRQQGAGE